MTAHSPPRGPGDLDLPEARRTRAEGRPDRTPPTGGEGAIVCGSGGGRRSRSAVRTISCICAKVPPEVSGTHDSGALPVVPR